MHVDADHVGAGMAWPPRQNWFFGNCCYSVIEDPVPASDRTRRSNQTANASDGQVVINEMALCKVRRIVRRRMPDELMWSKPMLLLEQIKGVINHDGNCVRRGICLR
jgi:hypothetical protein